MIRYFFERFVDLIRYLIRFITSFFRDTSDPVGDVLKFIANFERSFGTQHPEFYQGSYSQAIKDAKKELRFLLIYLHNPHSVEAQDFCTNVLTHNEVINYLTRNRIFFWACSTDSSEGYKVLQSLRENTFPLLALVTLVDNQMTVVEKFVGNTSVERFLSRLQRGIEDNEVSLITARLEREERDMNRMLREEQDKAYEESLRADQEKDRKKAEERKRKENEEREKNEREMNEIKKREQLIKLKLELAGKIPSEPSPTDPNAMRLMIKFPDGSRLERRFRKSDSVMSLYYFVFCQDASPLKFQITTNFPRRELPGRPPSLDDPLWNSQAASNGTAEPLPSLESLGLKKAEVLFVNDLEA